jgi:hypothetical protein
MGLDNIDAKMKINLSLLRRNTRLRSDKRSGHKVPRAGDYQITTAPDSMTSTKVNTSIHRGVHIHHLHLRTNDVSR